MHPHGVHDPVSGRVFSGAGLDLALIGGGGHALVVSETAAAAGWSVAGVYDDDPHAPLTAVALHLGRLAEACTGEDSESRRFIIAVGNLDVRARLIATLHGPWAIVAHPRAWISPSAAVGPGAFIGAAAIVQGRAAIGAHAIINTAAVIEHDTSIGENTHVAPGAVLGGDARVGPHSLIGLGARVLPGVRIGARCVVGTGAAVIRDVPDGTTVMGVPARTR